MRLNYRPIASSGVIIDQMMERLDGYRVLSPEHKAMIWLHVAIVNLAPSLVESYSAILGEEMTEKVKDWENSGLPEYEHALMKWTHQLTAIAEGDITRGNYNEAFEVFGGDIELVEISMIVAAANMVTRLECAFGKE